ncbi:MAG: gliding motility-associated C-terminal domain-containing protein [Flavobacteriales bacterium]
MVIPHANAQLDTEFWFAAPEVWASHGDQPIVLRFSTLSEAANVSVSQPANPAFPVQSIAVPANGTQTLNLTPWIDDIENTPFNTALSQGIYIESDAPITAYYEVNHQLNPDIFALKGSSALGLDFYVPFQNYLNNGYTQSKAGIDIVATEDGTEITITPSQDLVGYPAGTPFTINLDQGETYALRAANVAANLHPTGTLISSSAPIAVTISDDSIVGSPYQGSCMDLLGDQAIPISVAGNEYIAVKGNLNGPDKVFLVGTEDNTSLSIDGNYVWTLDAGETYAHTLTNSSAFYEADAPVIALHMTGFGCEVGGAILPPIQCTGSNEVAFVRSSNDFIGLKIIVQSGGEGDFEFNGSGANINVANFSAVPGTNGEWLFANITGSGFIPTGGPSRLVNATSKFHLGIINGGASSGTRYGYFSDFSNYQHETFAADDQLCAGETAELFATPILDATYEWTGPNGFTAEGSEITLGPLSEADAGLYIVSGMAGECIILPDTLEIQVAPQPAAPELIAPDPLCEGDDWEFIALTSADEWIWSDSDGDQIASDSVAVFENAIIGDEGAYQLSVVSQSCTSLPTSFNLIVFETFQIELDESSVEICEGSELTLQANDSPANPIWQWESPSGEITLGSMFFLDATEATDAGWYLLEGTSNGCPMLSDSIWVALSTPEPVELTVPEFVCQDASDLWFTTDDQYAGTWEADCAACLDEAGLFSPENAEPGMLLITYTSSNPCGQTESINLDVIAVADASFESLSYCEGMGDVALVSNTSGGIWSADCEECCSENGVFNTSEAGIGTWNITYQINGTCPSIGTGQFQVVPNTSSNFSLPSGACANDEPVILVADEVAGTWSASCGNCTNASSQFFPEIAGVGVHTVTYTIPGACGTSTSQNISVFALPDASFSYLPSEGCAPAVVQANAPFNPGIIDCSWAYQLNGIGQEQGCANSTFVLEEPGCYQLIHSVIDVNGCMNTALAESLLCLSAPPNSNFMIDPANPSMFDPLLMANSQEYEVAHGYEWLINSVGTASGYSIEFNPTELDGEPIQICLEVTDEVGCASLTCQTIEFSDEMSAYAPNAFTPDHDGNNDAWRMVVSESVSQFELQIFDRWGNLVFESMDPEEYWLGDVLGGSHFANDGIYHFHATLRDDAYHSKTLSGHILLIR